MVWSNLLLILFSMENIDFKRSYHILLEGSVPCMGFML